jgi:hypothetical protein
MPAEREIAVVLHSIANGTGGSAAAAERLGVRAVAYAGGRLEVQL